MFQRTLPAQGHLHTLFRRPTPIGRKDDRLSNLSQCLTEWKVHVLRGRQAIRSAWEFSELFLCVKRVGDTKMRREFQQCFSSTFYITYNKANITQFDAYLPYGELLVDEHSSSEDIPYKFNGKELDQETGLYYYGARYMNPLTNLWYGVDPMTEKYPSIGGYVYCAENPVNAVDLNGDSISIAYKSGFLGLGKKKHLLYEKGKLYNLNGNPYLGKIKGYLALVVEGLRDLRCTSEGAALITELETSTNMFTIKKGDSNLFKANLTTKAGGNLSEVQAVTGNTSKSGGSGGIIYWNHKINTGGLDVNGNIKRPSYIGLGHEMAHASDANQGLLYYPNDYTNAKGVVYSASYNGLEKAEWRAVYRENIIRGQAKIALRAYYGYDISSGKPQPIGPKLLSSQNVPLNYP